MGIKDENRTKAELIKELKALRARAKRLEKSASASDLPKFRELYSKSPIAIEIYDEDGRLEDANPACLSLFGVRDVKEIRGFRLFEDPNVTGEGKERLLKEGSVRYQGWFDFGKVKRNRLYRTSRSGKICVDVLITRIAGKKGKAAGGYMVQVQDITAIHTADRKLRNAHARLEAAVEKRTAELKAANENLEKEVSERRQAIGELTDSKRFLNSIVDGLADPVLIIGTDYRVSLMNKAARQMYGVASSESPLCHRLTHGSDTKCSEAGGTCPLDELAATGRATLMMHTHLTPEGRRRHIEISAAPLWRADGTLQGIIETARDVTERVEAEEAVRKSEASLAEAQRMAHTGSWEWDIDANRVNWSGELYRIFGVEPGGEDPTYEGIIGLLPPEERSFVEGEIKAALDERRPFDIKQRIIRPDGKEVYLHLFGEIISDGPGRPVLMRGTAQDITQSELMERALRESEERYRVMMDTANDAIFIADPETGIVLDCNMKACGLMGMEKEELVGIHQSDLHHPEDRQLSKEKFQSIRDKGNYLILDEAVRNRDGRRVNVEVSASIFESGGKQYALGIFRDVTKRKRMEAALLEANRNLETLLDAIPDQVLFKDPDGRHIMVNKAAADAIGMSREEVEGKSTEDLLPAEVAEQCRRSDEEAMNCEGLCRSEEHMAGNDGEIIHLDTIKVPISAGDDSPGGLVVIARDVTDRKRMEEALRQSLKEKEMLLREVHHRVKNNLAILSSLLRLQSRQVSDDETRGLFIESRNRVNVMSLIHEKLYRTEDFRGINFREYVMDFVARLVESYGPSAAGVRFDVRVSDAFLDVDTMVPCALIINELISNSVKHAFPDGRRGCITVEFSPDDQDGYVLVVRDDGVGLPEGLDFRNTETLGMQLVTSLTAQLGGTVEKTGGSGTGFRVGFREKKFRA